MNFQASIADDLADVLDGVEAITVSLIRNKPETVSVATANRGPMNRRLHAFSSVQFEDDDIGFVFQANQFVPTKNPAEIRHGDEFTDSAGVVYIVQSARLTVMQTVWNAIVRKK